MNSTSRNFVGKYSALFIMVLFTCTNAFSQFTTPRTTWDGPYDIKMIGSANQIPVYYNVAKSSTSELYIDSIVRQETYRRSGTRIDINNKFSSGFNTIPLPKTSFSCNQDPDVGVCTAGLPVTTNNSGCPAPATNFKTSPLTQNMPLILTYADYDNDNNTFSSSMSQLDVPTCTQIVSAYLYWTGAFKSGSNTLKLVDSPWNSFTVGVPNSSVFNNATFAAGVFDDVKIKIPGSATYTSITADQVIAGSGGSSRYVCFKDVTTLVNSGAISGQYWVADITSWPNDNAASSGWGLVLVYNTPASPPRRISIFDGYSAVPTSPGLTVTLTGLQVPATSNFKSYIGFGALDAEDVASEYPTPGTTPPHMQFTTGSTTTSINQFETRTYRYYDQNGFPTDCAGNALKDVCNAPSITGSCMVYDGVASSRISTYDEVADQNGAELTRLPAITNTYGFDLHHIKLPSGSVVPGATQASINLASSYSGGYNLFMTYIAIERLQPKLVMTKTPSVNTTTPGSTYNYTLRVTNIGNTSSLGARIFDTLDLANNYVTLASSTHYSSTGTNLGAAGVVLESSATDKLRFSMPAGNPIGINEYVDIVFTVNVEPASNTTLWNTQCKRTIENTAWVRYKASSAAGNTDSLTARSNSNDCGIGTETKVLVTGFTLTPTSVSSNTCPTSAVVDAVKAVLLTQPGITAAMLDDFDIRDASNVRVPATDMMSAVVAADMPFKAYRDVAVSPCQEAYNITFTGCSLPVELISFEGWRNGDANSLRWITAGEKDNDYFIVEGSFNGIDFTSIDKVKGNGSTSASQIYRFEDYHPASNGVVYYRLKQVDLNGAYTYSNIISISRDQAPELNIYPNPNNGSFTISVLAAEQSYKLDILDVEGRVVYTDSGDKIPDNIQVNYLAKGMYIVRFYLSDNTITKKLLVY